MPYYEIHHSYPLTTSQKTDLANSITKLHSRTFKTPSLFVNVAFHAHDASSADYFVGGVVRSTGANWILAMVRTSEARTKAHFDKLAEQVESAWYDVALGGPVQTEDGKGKGKRPGELDADPKAANGAKVGMTEKDRKATKLLFVIFHPMIAAREAGVVIPGAGEEGNWLKDNMAFFKDRAERGDEDFAKMLTEIDERDDLRKLLV